MNVQALSLSIECPRNIPGLLELSSRNAGEKITEVLIAAMQSFSGSFLQEVADSGQHVIHVSLGKGRRESNGAKSV